MGTDDKYFKDFFREKEGIQEWSWSEFENDEMWSFNYTKDDILKIILSFDPQTKRKVRDQFVKIDFHNGDINHYIDYLLKGYTKIQMGKEVM